MNKIQFLIVTVGLLCIAFSSFVSDDPREKESFTVLNHDSLDSQVTGPDTIIIQLQ